MIFMHPVVVSVMSFVIEVSLVAECSLEGRAGIGIEDDISFGKRLKKNTSYITSLRSSIGNRK